MIKSYKMPYLNLPQNVGARIFEDNVPTWTFSISIESTQNKQQYGTKIICTEDRKK